MSKSAKKDDASEKEAKSSKRKFKYVGPKYQQGIVIHQGPTIQPLKMSDDDIMNIIFRFPQAQTLWKKLTDS